MINAEYELDSTNFKSTSDVPKDEDLFYRCTDCEAVIPSIPKDNIGCDCGNIFIDKDCWRLIVVNIDILEVLRGESAGESGSGLSMPHPSSTPPIHRTC